MKCSRCLKTITKSSKSEVGVSIKGKSQPLCVECGDLIWSQRAYAVPITQEEVKQEPQKTLRDEFAMIALPHAVDDEKTCPTGPGGEATYSQIAVRAYHYADAMLAARNQTHNSSESLNPKS